MDWIQLISAAGLGGIIGSIGTTFLQAWLSDKATTRQRNFEVKKLAYVEFLEALNNSQKNPSEETTYREWYCINVCDLVSSKEVRNLLDIFVTEHFSSAPTDRNRAYTIGKIKQAMRKDLGFPV